MLSLNKQLIYYLFLLWVGSNLKKSRETLRIPIQLKTRTFGDAARSFCDTSNKSPL